MTRERVLVWDGCVNVRDLGGLPLEGGGDTSFRVLVRADSIGTLTEAGWAALRDYGVTTAVDLRGEHELEERARAQQRPIRIVSIPKDVHMQNNFGRYEVHYEYRGSVITVRREFEHTLARQPCDDSDYQQFRELATTIERDVKSQFLFQ